jgi:hypothetical protein
MNQHKPVGFRALWRDKRDSNSWDTLWAAVIFGISALRLAFAGLAVASAQTWAAFKALDLQKSSTARLLLAGNEKKTKILFQRSC